MTAVALIAQYLIVVPIALTVWAIISRRRFQFDISEAVMAGILTVVLVKIGGAAYLHARPFVVLHHPPAVPHAPDNAFPSDHLAACGLAVSYLWNRNRIFAMVTLACAVLIGAARVLTLLHWPLDVAAGFAFGIVAFAVTHTALIWWQRRSA